MGWPLQNQEVLDQWHSWFLARAEPGLKPLVPMVDEHFEGAGEGDVG
jgi:hypothetical protein